MNFRALFLFFIFLPAACAPMARDPFAEKLRQVAGWFVLYNDDSALPPAFRWEDYDMAILDPDTHPDLARAPQDLILIAYLSVGIAADYRSYWPKIRGQQWLSPVADGRGGKYYVDVRDPAWKRVLIDHAIPEIRQKGFHGIFLDTLGAPINREQERPAEFRGSRQALVDIVREIRRAHPDLMIISNNAFEVLPDLAPFLSAALGEAVHATTGSREGEFRLVESAERERKLGVLKHVARRHGLAVFIIDYMGHDRPDLVRFCVASSRELGFNPYIAQGRHMRFYEQRAA